MDADQCLPNVSSVTPMNDNLPARDTFAHPLYYPSARQHVNRHVCARPREDPLRVAPELRPMTMTTATNTILALGRGAQYKVMRISRLKFLPRAALQISWKLFRELSTLL